MIIVSGQLAASVYGHLWNCIESFGHSRLVQDKIIQKYAYINDAVRWCSVIRLVLSILILSWILALHFAPSGSAMLSMGSTDNASIK